MKIELKEKPEIAGFIISLFSSLIAFIITAISVELTMSYFGHADSFNIGNYISLIFIGMIFMLIFCFIGYLCDPITMRSICIRCKKRFYQEDLLNLSKKKNEYDNFYNDICENCLKEIKKMEFKK